MTQLTRRGFAKGAAVLGAAGLIGVRANAAEVTKLNVVGFVDYTGPYAIIAKDTVGGREAAMRWWNAEVGAKLNGELRWQNFDTRSDPAVAASLWPSVAAAKPLLILSFGASDANPLHERLPEAGIPLFFSGACPIGLWQPDSWVFAPRASYAHDIGTFFDYMYAKKKATAPIKVAMVSSQSVPLYVDMVKGVEAYAKASRKISLAYTIWDAPQPTDLTSQVKEAVKESPEYFIVQTNVAQGVALVRGLQALGKDIPCVFESHCGLGPTAKALGDASALENCFEAHPLPMPIGQSEPKRFYDLLVAKYGLAQEFSPMVANGILHGLFVSRAVEAAISKHGIRDLTGQKIRDALRSETLRGFFGFVPDMRIEPAEPFPLNGAINVASFKNGKYVEVASQVPLTKLPKW